MRSELPISFFLRGIIFTMTEDDFKKKLNPEQYHVLREKGTEAPFTGKYVNTKDAGMYKCAACGAELFSSDTKFDSHTGWPSFTQPVRSSGCYVYVLKMSNGQLYVGSTCNLVNRVKEHQSGRVFTTKKYLPASLIYYENYGSEKEARMREKTLKHHGSAFAKLKGKIMNNKEILLAGFTEPANLENVRLEEDRSGGMVRTEVVCKNCGSHLGHVFDDLPRHLRVKAGGPMGGKRYCINSCALDLDKRHGSGS